MVGRWHPVGRKWRLLIAIFHLRRNKFEICRDSFVTEIKSSRVSETQRAGIFGYLRSLGDAF